jgi:alkanesulfonate monooxygenase SsuD/methylene tetrahydromethanopterin reductase-like flavin-dependent oxidoreductase (luciferase family)
MVSPATFRHPSVLARMAVTVDHISGGRVEVGMGSGWYEREHLAHGFPFPSGKERFELFAEQVEIVIRSWTEERFDHDGPTYRLQDQQALPRPLQQPHPPLVLGGTVKPRFAALAARYATEVNTLGAPNDALRARKAALDDACAEAGRDPATLARSLMTACFLGETTGDVRDRVARFLDVAAPPGTDPDAFLAERRDRWLVGTLDEVSTRLEELRAVGITRVFLQHLNHDDDALIRLAATLR